MTYKIIGDSCLDLTEELKRDPRFQMVPLTLQVGAAQVVDDETFDQADFLKRVSESPECPKSSCPSPERYMESYQCDAQRVYAVTLSAELSGSYNSAVLGKNLYTEEHGEKQIYVFNSRSASIGETLIAQKIAECEEQGMEFEQVIAAVEKFIARQNTYFVLESLETLRKNGRLSGVKALVASALNFKRVMGGSEEGSIYQIGQARGMKKALVKLVDTLVEKVEDPENKILAIAHCNCKERANDVRKMIEEKIHVRDVIILDTKGISSMYASDGGIIVSI